MNLSNEDVQDILSLLDSLPYGELTVETSSFTLRLRRSPAGGWVQETHVRSQPVTAGPAERPSATGAPSQTGAPPAPDGHPPGKPGPAGSAGDGSVAGSTEDGSATGGTAPGQARPAGELRDVLAPLLGTFYRAPQPGAPPFVDIGSHVEPDTVVAIIETMKLMNPVYAGTTGTVSEICLHDGQFAEQDSVLMRVSAQAG